MKNLNKFKITILVGFLTLGSSVMFPNLSHNYVYASQEDDHGDDHEEEGVLRLSAEEREKDGIETSIIKERLLPNIVSAPGEVKPNFYKVSQITSRIPAQVIARNVEMGEFVEKGQSLVTLSSVDMAEAQGNLILSQQEWKRAQALGKGVISEQRYFESKIKAQQAKAKVLAFGMNASQVDIILNSEDASAASGVYDLFAPQEGTVTQDIFVMGQFIEPGTSLMMIVDEESIWVEAQLQPHKAATIVFRSKAWIMKDNVQVNGSIVQIHHTVDEISRTLAVRAEFDNSNHTFHSGEFVNIEIQADKGSLVLAVPTEAVTILEGKNTVFKLEGNELHPKKVELGRSIGDWTEILSGIQAGDEIVTKQTFFVKSLILKSKIGEGHAH